MANIEILIYTGLFWALFFGIFIFTTFFENKKRIYNEDKKQILPLISLMVPCYNEADNISGVLNSILDLDYPKEKLEVIVIDDGSTDNTLKLARQFEKNHKQIQVFHKKNGGKHTALNLALTKTKGEFVGCVDADCYVEKTALKNMLKYFETPKVAVVVATIKILRPDSILQGIQYAEYLISAFLKKMLSFLDSIIVTPGPLSLFRREIFDIVGNYKEAHMTEDLEMALRLQSKNLKIAHAVESTVYTQGQSSLKGLCRQRLRWRRGFLLNLKDYPELLNLKKHGNLSFLLLYNIFGAFLSISIVCYTLYKLTNFLIIKVNNAILINFDFAPYLTRNNLHAPTISTRPAFLFGIIGLSMLFAFLLLGKKYTFDKVKMKQKAFFYIIAYSFLNAIWWISAGFSILFKRKITWS